MFCFVVDGADCIITRVKTIISASPVLLLLLDGLAKFHVTQATDDLVVSLFYLSRSRVPAF